MTQGFRGKRVNWKDHPDFDCGRAEAEAFCMRKVLEGYTHVEIGKMLNMSAGWVCKTLKSLDVASAFPQGVTKSKRRKTKLTADQVREIRVLKLSNKRTAERYGVTRWYVSAIRRGAARKEVI